MCSPRRMQICSPIASDVLRDKMNFRVGGRKSRVGLTARHECARGCLFTAAVGSADYASWFCGEHLRVHPQNCVHGMLNIIRDYLAVL
jgi:hypothetical protein